MHFLVAGGVPPADRCAQLGSCRSLITELLLEIWADMSVPNCARSPIPDPLSWASSCKPPFLMCNCIYLFIFLLLDAKLLKQHLPHKHPQLRGRREGGSVCCVCAMNVGPVCAGSGWIRAHGVCTWGRRKPLRLNQKYFAWVECATLIFPELRRGRANLCWEGQQDSCRAA